MKLNFTKKEYRYLVEICLLGSYIIEQSNIDVSEDYRELLKHILFSGDSINLKINDEVLEGMEQIASTVIKNMNFSEEFLDCYNERVFWNGLATRMASRDALEELGNDVTEENFSEFLRLKSKYEKKYIEKFVADNYNNRGLPY